MTCHQISNYYHLGGHPKYSHTYDVYFRPAGVFAKVNRIVFTQQGNKFGVCDGDGNTALWQVNS